MSHAARAWMVRVCMRACVHAIRACDSCVRAAREPVGHLHHVAPFERARLPWHRSTAVTIVFGYTIAGRVYRHARINVAPDWHQVAQLEH